MATHFLAYTKANLNKRSLHAGQKFSRTCLKLKLFHKTTRLRLSRAKTQDGLKSRVQFAWSSNKLSGRFTFFREFVFDTHTQAASAELRVELQYRCIVEEMSHTPFHKFKSKSPPSAQSLFGELMHVIGRYSTTLQPKPLSDGCTASETKIVGVAR